MTASTLVTLRNRIGERLQDTGFKSISSASVDDVINQVIKYYKYKRFWFNDTLATITLNAGDPIMPSLPSDFLAEIDPGGLSIFYNNIYYPVNKIPTEGFDYDNRGALGLPYQYTFRNQGFELYFFPNIAYTLKLRYLKDYALLVNNSDSNDFLSNAEMMIYYNALSRIYGEYKQDEKMEKYYTTRANDEAKNVRSRSTALMGTGSITINSNLL